MPLANTGICDLTHTPRLYGSRRWWTLGEQMRDRRELGPVCEEEGLCSLTITVLVSSATAAVPARGRGDILH